MKMNNNKELISRVQFFSFVHEWIKPLVDINNDHDGGFECSSGPIGFNWCLKNFEGGRTHFIEALLIDDHWEISNGDKKYINIQIFNDHIEFSEDSKFRDFSKEEMYSLYTFLNERIFGIKEERKLVDIPKSIDKNVEYSKRNVPLKTMEEICKDNGVEWKPNNDNPNNNIKVDSNAEVNTFGDGAVRSSKKGKGRYDLIPGCVMVDVINSLSGKINHMTDSYVRSYKSILLRSIYKRNWVGAIVVLTILGYYDEKTPNEIDAFNKMQKDLAIHYENGAEIYGENNWKKGIPKESFISSGIRHTQQWLSGLNDEPHLISAIWNFCNAAWCEKKEELYK